MIIMRVLLVRHGESEGNIDESRYIAVGDQHIDLTDNGWVQAHHTGLFLKDYYASLGLTEWPHIFLSPYTRTRQTFSGIVHGMSGFRDDLPKIREDSRLVEKFFGAASALEYLNDKDVPPEITKALQKLFRRVYQNDPFTTRGLFGDSFKDIVGNAKSFMDGTLDRDAKMGHDNFLIVTHGAVIQAFILAWIHLRIEDKNKIGNPHNGDVIEIAGSSKNWTVRRIYNGKDRTAVSEYWLENVKPFSAEDLPPFPTHLEIK
jgi:broad specificity phosphatase PhoE